jgi:hypothetical protein
MSIFRSYSGCMSALFCLFNMLGYSWTDPVTLSGAGSYYPYAAINEQGEAVVIWTCKQDTALLVQAATFDGKSWSVAETLAEGTQIDPKIGIDSQGNAIAVWEKCSKDGTAVMCALKPASSKWSEPQVLYQHKYNLSSALAFNQAGQVLVGWVNQHEGVVQLLSYSFEGAWSEVQTIRREAQAALNLRLQLNPSGQGVAVWQEADVNQIWAALMMGDFGFGTSWSEPQVVSGNDAAREPCVSINSKGDLIIAWSGLDDGCVRSIKYMGGSWEDAPTVSPFQSDAPQTGSFADGFFLNCDNLAAGSIQCLRYFRGGWEAVADLSGAASIRDFALSVGLDGISINGWTDVQTGHLVMVECPSDGSPGAPYIISIPDVNVHLSLAASKEYAVAAWGNISGLDECIQVSLKAK